MCLSYLIIFRHFTDDLEKCKIVSVIWLEYYPVIRHWICFCYMIGVFSCYMTFLSIRLLSVLRGHSVFLSPPQGQWPPTSKDFYIRSYPLHYFLIFILLWHWICLTVCYMKVKLPNPQSWVSNFLLVTENFCTQVNGEKL